MHQITVTRYMKQKLIRLKEIHRSEIIFGDCNTLFSRFDRTPTQKTARL
jgi:hypothetical protein